MATSEGGEGGGPGAECSDEIDATHPALRAGAQRSAKPLHLGAHLEGATSRSIDRRSRSLWGPTWRGRPPPERGRGATMSDDAKHVFQAVVMTLPEEPDRVRIVAP